MSSPTVLVFEHCFRVGGHRLPYASLAASAFPAADVLVSLPSCLRDCPEIEHYFGPCRLGFFDAPTPPSSWQSAKSSIHWLNRMIAEHSPDQVVIPTADGMATMAGAPFLASIENRRTPIHVGLMIGRRPSSELTRSRRLFNEVKWRSIRRAPFRHVVLMDPRAWSELEAADELLLGPDPVPALGERHREEARRQLGLDPNSKWVVSAGNQDERKGVPELIKGFCHIDRPPSHRLLLIGKCSAAVQSVLSDVSSHPNFDQIEVRDQFVSEEEFVSSIVAADVVAALYRNTMRPSGIVSRCITWGIPVLARDAGWLRWAVNTFQAGWRTQPNDLDALSSALENALKSSDRFQVSAAAKAFGEFNSESNYQALWRGLVEGTDVPRPSAELLEAIR